jgi:hypothetical protein
MKLFYDILVLFYMSNESKNLLEKYAEVLYDELNSNEINIFNIQEEIKYHTDILNNNQKLVRYNSLQLYSLKNYYDEDNESYFLNEKQLCEYNILEADKNIKSCIDKLRFHQSLMNEKILAYHITQDKIFFKNFVINTIKEKVRSETSFLDLYNLNIKSKKLIKEIYSLKSFEKINDKFNNFYNFFNVKSNVYNTFIKINQYLTLEKIKFVGFVKFQSEFRKWICMKKYNFQKIIRLKKIKNYNAIKIQSFYRCYIQRKKYNLLKEEKKISISESIIKNLINRTMNIIKKKEKKSKEDNNQNTSKIVDNNKELCEEKEKEDVVNTNCILTEKQSKKYNIIVKKRKKKKKKKSNEKKSKTIDKIDDKEFYKALEEYKEENERLKVLSEKEIIKTNAHESKIETKIKESKSKDTKGNIESLIFNNEKNQILKMHKQIINDTKKTHIEIMAIYDNLESHNFFSEIKMNKFSEFIVQVTKLSVGVSINNIETNNSYKFKIISALDNSIRLKNFLVNQNALYYKMRLDLLLMRSDLLFISKLMKKDFKDYEDDKLDNSFSAIINYPFSSESCKFLEELIKYYDDSNGLELEKVSVDKKATFTLIQILFSFYHINFHRLYNYIRTCANVEFYTRPISYDFKINLKDQYSRCKKNLIFDWEVLCKAKNISKDLRLEKEYINWKLIK